MSWMLRTGLILTVCLIARSAYAEEDDDKKPGKGKGKSEAKPTTIQVDLSKLPPDLAKQLMKYAGGIGQMKVEKGPSPKAAPQAKTPATAEAKGPPAHVKKMWGGNLPPGLAKKAANHPGRANYVKNVLSSAKPTKAAPATPPKKKGKGGEEE